MTENYQYKVRNWLIATAILMKPFRTCFISPLLQLKPVGFLLWLCRVRRGWKGALAHITDVDYLSSIAVMVSPRLGWEVEHLLTAALGAFVEEWQQQFPSGASVHRRRKPSRTVIKSAEKKAQGEFHPVVPATNPLCPLLRAQKQTQRGTKPQNMSSLSKHRRGSQKVRLDNHPSSLLPRDSVLTHKWKHHPPAHKTQTKGKWSFVDALYCICEIISFYSSAVFISSNKSWRSQVSSGAGASHANNTAWIIAELLIAVESFYWEEEQLWPVRGKFSLSNCGTKNRIHPSIILLTLYLNSVIEV